MTNKYRLRDVTVMEVHNTHHFLIWHGEANALFYWHGLLKFYFTFNHSKKQTSWYIYPVVSDHTVHLETTSYVIALLVWFSKMCFFFINKWIFIKTDEFSKITKEQPSNLSDFFCEIPKFLNLRYHFRSPKLDFLLLYYLVLLYCYSRHAVQPRAMNI